MGSSDLSRAAWRKSSRSNRGVDGNCVEVAGLPDEVVLRDSKDPAGLVLVVSRAGWCAFLGGMQTGWFG